MYLYTKDNLVIVGHISNKFINLTIFWYLYFL